MNRIRRPIWSLSHGIWFRGIPRPADLILLKIMRVSVANKVFLLFSNSDSQNMKSKI